MTLVTGPLSLRECQLEGTYIRQGEKKIRGSGYFPSLHGSPQILGFRALWSEWVPRLQLFPLQLTHLPGDGTFSVPSSLLVFMPFLCLFP